MAKATAKRKATPADKVTKAQLDAGLKAIRATYEQYYRPEGLADLHDKIREESKSLSRHIMGLATDVSKSGKGVEVFLNICTAAETAFREEYAANPENQTTADKVKLSGPEGILPAWSQYKSNIKRAWSYRDAKGKHPFTPGKFKGSAESMNRAFIEQKKKDDEQGGEAQLQKVNQLREEMELEPVENVQEHYGAITASAAQKMNLRLVARLSQLSAMVQRAAGNPAAEAELSRILEAAETEARDVLNELMGEERPEPPTEAAEDETEDEAANA